jgi:hypothetical protein
MPISVAAGRAAVAEAFLPHPQAEFPPVDGFLVKLVAQVCFMLLCCPSSTFTP